jgi:ketosteroid isomerase-like protein
MKKYLPLFIVVISSCCISCNNQQAGPSAATQKNLDAMHAVTQAFDTKDFSKIGDYIAADAVDHAGENGDIKGIDSIKAQFVKWTAEMDNGKTVVIKELADDEYVMSWVNDSGTYKTDGMGHKAGDTFSVQAIEVAKFKDGKVTEHWTMMSPTEVMKMMGTMSTPTMPTPADSVKMKK